MTTWHRILVLVLVLGIVLPVLALTQPSPQTLKKNKDELVKLKNDPGRLAFLYLQTQEFLALPAEKQNQLRQIDEDLHKLPPARVKQLLQEMKQYKTWLEQLPEDKRKQVEQAATPEERLQVVRKIRDQQWIDTQPSAFQEKLARLEGEAWQKQIDDWKRPQRLWHAHWRIAQNHWDDLTKPAKKHGPLPVNFEELTPEVQSYTKKYLSFVATESEWQRLEKAADQPWPEFAFLLVSLADKYPPALNNGRGPTSLKELPKEVETLLKRGKLLPLGKLKDYEGKWPDFPIYVTEHLSKERLNLPNELWPTQTSDLSFPVRDFLDRDLKPLLSKKEEEQLESARGRWPEFPQTIDQLARKNSLQVPWQTLPGNRDDWDGYRVGYNPFLEKGEK